MWKTAFSLAFCSVLAAGCDSRVPQVRSQPEAQLRKLGTLYGEFIAQNKGRAPANEEQFREYLKAEHVQLRNLEIGGVAALLSSPFDGQKLVVRYGNLTGPVSPNGYPWIANEQTGVDGKIKVISARGEVREVSEQELEELFATGNN